MGGIEFAHQQARALLHRATLAEYGAENEKGQPLVTYKGIVELYRNERPCFPEPLPEFTRKHQTDTGRNIPAPPEYLTDCTRASTGRNAPCAMNQEHYNT
ncbi:hypothetical protein HPB52_013451 [Rhipicephalus sanguineus]|uniref:Uncharacterized protein n=1 Tax=Rhipicephalus sanguineus TaxID=34632 RepID=A0A9D4PIR4_RHISA|nr:hypothetical protein HPB52_013451 [Rhipicephalus sanguineus]